MKKLLKDDLYEAVNGAELAQLEIPEDRSIIGSFSKIAINIEEILLRDLANLDLQDDTISPQMKDAHRLYQMFLQKDQKEIFTPQHSINKYITGIQSISNFQELNTFIRENASVGANPFFRSYIHADMGDSQTNTLYLDAQETILPDKLDYGTERGEKLLEVHREMTTKILQYFQIPNVEKVVNNMYLFDAALVPNVKTSVELADYTKSYNPQEFQYLKSLNSFFDFEGFFGFLIPVQVKKIVIIQPKYFEHFNEMFAQMDLEVIKDYLLSRYLTYSTDYFTEDLREIASAYSRAVNGNPKIKTIDKFSLGAVQRVYGDVIGLYYGLKYFGEAAKKDIYRLVNALIDTYKIRLQENPWLETQTKEKAILKLSTMKVMMAYPDKLPEVCDKLSIDETADLYANVVYNYSLLVMDNYHQYGKPVDHTRWGMSADTVNAYYSPTSNLICFPAGILQAPFYSLEQGDSKNFGGIGAVIGHEISHAFDNNGANFDEKGNLNNWWSEKDLAKFQEFTTQVIDLYQDLEIEGEKVNGTLTVSENIADLAGLRCALDSLCKQPQYDLSEFFQNWARIWQAKIRPEYLKLLVTTDVHSPTKIRTNTVVKNLDEFYTTFEIQENDGMYLEPVKRVTIW